MTAPLIFDVFPANDPNGTALGELTAAYGKQYRHVHQAIGFGQFTINRHDAQAAWAAMGNLVRVRRVTGGPFEYDDSRYVGAFWIEQGDDILLDGENEEGGEELTRGGRTAEVCLRWARLYPDAKDSRNAQFTTHTREDGNWHIDDRTAGEVLAIVIRDLDDRTPDPLPFVTKDFGVAVDSNGDAWTDTGTDWQLPVGSSLLDVLETCVSGDLYYRCSPAFVFSAYEDEPGDDLTASVVITKGVNIIEAAERQVHAPETVGRVIVQGTKESGRLKYREVINATVEADLPGRREGFVEFKRTPTNAKLDRAGNRYIRKLKKRHDGIPQLKAYESTGQEAFTDYVPGDLVTLDIDDLYESAEVRVYAITLEEDEAGNVDPVLEFEQSPFDPATNRDGEISGGNGNGGGNGNCGDCPPIPPFVPCVTEGDSDPVGAAIAVLLGNGDTTGAGASRKATNTGDSPPSGWAGKASSAGLTPTSGTEAQIENTDSDTKIVRVIGDAWVNTVLNNTTGTFTVRLLKNGAEVASDQISKVQVGAASWVEQLVFDWPGIELAPGDVLKLEGEIDPDTGPGGWGGFGSGHWRGHMIAARGVHSIPEGVWAGTVDFGDDVVATEVPCVPLEGQAHVEETVGDGSTVEFQTNYPYAPGSLEVHVDGLLWPVTETDPETGTFTFDTAPPDDAVIIIRYQNAGTTPTGATNTVPVASTPTGSGAHTHDEYELRNEGGQSLIDDDSFPNAGATADYDPTDGNVFTRTLNANHTGTILQPVGDGAATLEWWIDTGAGGFTFELEADGGTVQGDISGHTLDPDETFRVIGERIPGTTNDWIVDLVGGGASLTFDDGAGPEPVALVAEPGDDAFPARRDHVHDLDPDAVEVAGHWEPLMDGGSPYAPLDDGTGTDWLFVWVPG